MGLEAIALDWKQQAEDMIINQKLSIRETARRLNHLFPGKTFEQMRVKITLLMQKNPKYKASLSKTDITNKPQIVEHNSDGQTTFEGIIALADSEPITPEAIMKAYNLDVSKWEVVAWRSNFWQSQRKGGSVMLLYQSRITVKPTRNKIDLSAIDKHFAKLDRKNFTPPIISVPQNSNMMCEINIADLHLGKLCWYGNTGENYDYKIARDIYYEMLSEIITEVKRHSLEYITFVWANDFFNADTPANTTTGLTPQECDVRWQKMFNVGVEMLVNGIGMMQELRVPIKTFYTPSNHDEVNGYHALKYLEAWFRSDSSMDINTDAYPRKYQMYGNTLIGYTHGNKENSKSSKEKASRLASLMPIEAPDMWSKSKTREFHAAHLHSEQMIQEINGVIVRRISSPTAADTYHATNGYIGAVRKAQTFLYDKDRGHVQTIHTPVGRGEVT